MVAEEDSTDGPRLNTRLLPRPCDEGLRGEEPYRSLEVG